MQIVQVLPNSYAKFRLDSADDTDGKMISYCHQRDIFRQWTFEVLKSRQCRTLIDMVSNDELQCNLGNMCDKMNLKLRIKKKTVRRKHF